MSEQVSFLWAYRTASEFHRVAITNDGELIFVGGVDGALYCLALEGEVHWRIDLHSVITSIALAQGSERLLVGCQNGKIYEWTYQGHLLREFEITGKIEHITATPTAHLMVISTSTGMLTLLDARGSPLWSRTLGSLIYHPSISSSGHLIACGAGNHIFLFDHHGNEQWRFFTQSDAQAGTLMNVSGEVVLAGSNDKHIYLFSGSEYPRWSYNTSGSVKAVALTPDGRLVAAASTSNSLILLDRSGKHLWHYTTKNHVQNLVISHDGSFVFAATSDKDNSVLLFDQRGSCLWTKRLGQHIHDVAMTPNGRLIVVVSQDRSVELFENLLAPTEMSSDWLAADLITELHTRYAANPYEGIAACLDYFDQALLQRDLELCDALSEEITTGDWILQAEEQIAFSSRIGATLLYQGLRHQQHGEIEQALQKYELSSEINTSLHYPTGIGKAHAARQSLEYDYSSRNESFVSLLTDSPDVIGNSSLFLVRGTTANSLSEQRLAIQAAQKKGHLIPLLAGLSSVHESVQAAAAIALTWLIPGPEMDTLLEMLTHSNWIVRWQAAIMLEQHARRSLKMFAQHQRKVCQTVAERLSQEPDPVVLATMVILLGKIGDASLTPLVLPSLEDAEADVRLGAIEALEHIGSRQALVPLRHVADGAGFLDRSISKSAEQAVENIRRRYPGHISQIICSQQLGHQAKPVQPATLFLMNNLAFHCMVTLTEIAIGTRVTCDVKFQNQAMLQQEILVKALASEPDAKERASVDAVFTFDAPKKGWSPGVYTIEIALDGMVQKTQTIKVIREVIIGRAVMCSGLTSANSPIEEREAFVVHTPVIYCSLALEEGLTGLDVEGKVFRVEREAASSALPKRDIWGSIREKLAKRPEQNLKLIDQSIVKTKAEGEQWVALAWKTVDWPPGEYLVKITIARRAEATCKFLITSSTD